ncbi:MAG: hypothetical protein HC927_02015 [Deltaproteobacteria bacterium]|nr:hypothetical protein [Deltaproteobacteria bacterium]
MSSYNPSIIQQHAQRLYGQATTITAVYTILGVFGGALSGVLAKPFLGRGDPASDFSILLVAMVACGLVGFFVGNLRGFDLRLQAQVALCQLQIEINTRQTAQAVHASAVVASSAGPGALVQSAHVPGYPQPGQGAAPPASWPQQSIQR